MPSPESETPPDLSAKLGVSGYVFSDLHDPERLASLYERFDEGVRAADPELWRAWDGYRGEPDAPRSPLTLSDLLMRMASHVSAFVTRLFDIDGDASTGA